MPKASKAQKQRNLERHARNKANIAEYNSPEVRHQRDLARARRKADLDYDRKMEKLRKEAEALGKASFAFAFYMDRQKDERERGVTIACTTDRTPAPTAPPAATSRRRPTPPFIRDHSAPVMRRLRPR